jgi:hypothetical protein
MLRNGQGGRRRSRQRKECSAPPRACATRANVRPPGARHLLRRAEAGDGDSVGDSLLCRVVDVIAQLDQQAVRP